MSTKTPRELRKALADDIYKWGNLTLPVNDHLLKTIFAEVSINLWSQYLGITLVVEKHPDPEWHCQRTITFIDNRQPEQEEYDLIPDDL